MTLKRFEAALTRNVGLDRARPYGPAERAVASLDALAEVGAEIAGWPGYAPTPLVAQPGLAAALGLGDVWLKDEGARFSLMSFKALGGAYAVLEAIRDRAEAAGEGRPASADLRAGRRPASIEGMTVACATDGNHGRSVAWGAGMFGCRCVIHLHAEVSEGREREIARFGAEIRRVPGDYDESLRVCAEEAAREGWTVVADTSTGLRDDTAPRRVMQGYGLIAEEVDAALAAAGASGPTHVFVPAAVGGLAAGLLATWWERWGADRPVFVGVEPRQADCLSRSLAAGRPVAAEGKIDSFMACLAAGELSPAAWPILGPGMDWALTLPDAAAAEAMRVLADAPFGDPPVAAGESGAAATAALIAAASDPEIRAALELGPEARVLCICSEGATDAETFRRTVGRAPEAVVA